jgi:hypothetical protein
VRKISSVAQSGLALCYKHCQAGLLLEVQSISDQRAIVFDSLFHFHNPS